MRTTAITLTAETDGRDRYCKISMDPDRAYTREEIEEIVDEALDLLEATRGIQFAPSSYFVAG